MIRIHLEDLHAGSAPDYLLRDISWEIAPPGHWVITGAMGAGKTTLARIMAGKILPSGGRIRFFWQERELGWEERRRIVQLVSFTDHSRLFRNPNAVHYYQQRYNAFDADGHLTLRQYLQTGGFTADDPRHQAILRTMGLDHLLDRERIKLSSGQTRRMLLTRALLCTPRVLILDNPYLGLDAAARHTLNELLDELVGRYDMTLILTGPQEDLPGCITHRLHLETGRVKAKGTLDEVKRIITAPPPPIDQETLKDIRSYIRTHTPAGEFRSVLHMEKVNVRYGETVILRDLDWQVLPGEKWSLLGPNGAGKSTLLSLIYGDNPQAYANRISLFDRRRGSGESIWDIKRRIGFTSGELHAFFHSRLPAGDLVLTGLSDTFALHRPPSAGEAAFSRLLFRFFGVENQYLRPFQACSTGMQRLLFFMRALIKAPQVLLLDEPFQGLDEATVYRCRVLLDHILDDRHTLIFITHYAGEIPGGVSRRLVLHLPNGSLPSHL